MIAVSVDPVEKNRDVVDKLGLDYSILSDADREAITSFGVVHSGASIDGGDIARPATFIIGPEGRVRWRELTENWRVRLRPEMVLDALEDLG